MISTDLDKAINALCSGGVVALPTDTVYCLAASLKSEDSVKRVFEIKGRDAAKGLPVLVADIDQFRYVSTEVSSLAVLLIQRFMPGALTIVVRKQTWVSNMVTGGKDTVAVRIPDHPLPLRIIEGLNAPITGTSANLSGQPNTLTAAEVEYQLGSKVDLILDGGTAPGGVVSTIVDLSGVRPVILREGAVRRCELESFLSWHSSTVKLGESGETGCRL